MFSGFTPFTSDSCHSTPSFLSIHSNSMPMVCNRRSALRSFLPSNTVFELRGWPYSGVGGRFEPDTGVLRVEVKFHSHFTEHKQRSAVFFAVEFGRSNLSRETPWFLGNRRGAIRCFGGRFFYGLQSDVQCGREKSTFLYLCRRQTGATRYFAVGQTQTLVYFSRSVSLLWRQVFSVSGR